MLDDLDLVYLYSSLNRNGNLIMTARERKHSLALWFRLVHLLALSSWYLWRFARRSFFVGLLPDISKLWFD